MSLPHCTCKKYMFPTRNFMVYVCVLKISPWETQISGFSFFTSNVPLRITLLHCGMSTDILSSILPLALVDIWYGIPFVSKLTCILTFQLAFYLTSYLAFYLVFYLTSCFAFYLAFYMAFHPHSIWHLSWAFVLALLWHSFWRFLWHSWHLTIYLTLLAFSLTFWRCGMTFLTFLMFGIGGETLRCFEAWEIRFVSWRDGGRTPGVPDWQRCILYMYKMYLFMFQICSHIKKCIWVWTTCTCTCAIMFWHIATCNTTEPEIFT